MIDHPYLDQLRQALGARYSPDTTYHTLNQAGRFLEAIGVKEQYSAQDLLGYADRLLQDGYRSSSVATILTAVKALFRAIGHPWPLEKGKLHLPPSEASGPVLTHQEVASLIKIAQQVGRPEVQVVALSSLWGLRAIEITRVLETGIEGPQLLIQTAKGGHRRRHLIPAGLAEILTFGPVTLSRGGLQLMFRRLMRQGVRKPLPGEGWHSLRRTLVTGLLAAGLDSHKVETFMAWRTGRTIASYYRPDAGRLDQEVYGLHPFLELWG